MSLLPFVKPNIEKMLMNHDVKGLIKAFGHKEREIQLDAIKALGKVGEPAIEPLILAIKENKIYQDQIASALGRIGKPAIESLINCLRDKDKDVRKVAAEALASIKAPAIGQLIESLHDNDYGVRAGAAWALVKIGELSVEPLFKALKEVDWRARANAAEALGKIGDLRAAIPLADALYDVNKDVKCNAAEALGLIGANSFANKLYALLKDESRDVRAAAVRALDKLNWKTSNHEEECLYALSKREWDKLLDIVNEDDINLLVGFLCDESNDVREGVARSLGKIGASVIEPMIAILHDENEDARIAAVSVLAVINDERAIDPLIGVMRNDANPLNRKRARDILNSVYVGSDYLLCPECLTYLGTRAEVRNIGKELTDEMKAEAREAGIEAEYYYECPSCEEEIIVRKIV